MKGKKKILLRPMLVVVILIVLWVIVAPGCMTFRMTDENAKKQFRKKGLELKTGFVEAFGRTIHYTNVGNDSLPTLFFLHGSPSTWNSFMEYMQDPELLFYCRMVSIDRPGFGYSEGSAVNLSEQSKLMLEVVRQLNNGKSSYLAGHSLGGPLAVKMAADGPSWFKGISLISGSVSPELEPAEKWRFVFDKIPLKYFLPGAFRPSNTELVYFKSDVKELLEDFPKVGCNVYLIHGEKDKWVPPGNVQFASEKLTGANRVETIILPGGNHFIPWTRKKEVKAALIRMIEESEKMPLTEP